jgi:polyferredoxin
MRDRTLEALRGITHSKVPSYKWFLGLIMATVIALGWKYPLLGFIVPVAMTLGIVGGFFKGRWVCGNLCPRGSFLDTWFSLISAKRSIPAWVRSMKLRWTLLTFLMGFMFYRLSQNATSIEHWGLVFWQMCLITTIAALVLGMLYSGRSWCAICPVGTMASATAPDRQAMEISASCKGCGLCEKACPMQLDISRYREVGKQLEKDCLKCSSCMQVCPQKAVLSWPERKAA